MYLSKLEIFGFKSFANKTHLMLNDGVTAIVGPNGCGKTNIVDALRWALGEQRYSTLRSDKMEDVIFNGTKTRKPIGVAEVSLTIQNNKGILPLEYDELTITRRVFRSGESDYMINKTVCRLKDIISLFMDTGMGSNAYSVIELKMIETILSDKMEERRRLFEEAAGVTRYKARRKETIRKLAEVESDLLRVDDIISEVEKAVHSLNRQARKAERYNQLIERVRTLEIDVLERDYTSLLQRLEPLQDRLSNAVIERDSMHTQLESEEALLQQCRAEEREIEERLERERRDLAAQQTRINEYEQNYVVAQERERALKESVQRLSASREENLLRIEQNVASQKEIGERIEAATLSMTEVEEEHKRHRDSHAKLEAAVSKKKLETQARQSHRMQLIQDVSRVQGEIDRAAARMEAIDKAIQRLTEEESSDQAQLRTLLETREREGSSQVRISNAAIEAEREFHAMEERKQAIRAEIDVLQNRAFELQGQIGEKMTRIDFLNGLVDRLEGYSESVQHLLRHRDWSTSRLETIADSVNTRDELRVAIESALGDAAHYLIVNDIAEAISGLHNLKSSRKGKATFVCLSRLPRVRAVPFAIAGEGVIGWAADLVTHDPQLHDLFQYLLRNVLVIRDTEIAHATIREYPSIRCVTLDGDIFDSDGIVRGGSHGLEEGGLIGKKDQIARLSQEVAVLKKRLAENQQLLEEKNSEHNSIDLRQFTDRMKQTQLDLSAYDKQVAQTVFEIDKLERSIRKNADERTRLTGERREAEKKQQEYLPEATRLLTQQQEADASAESDSGTLQDLEREYAASSERLNALKVTIVQREGEIRNFRNELARLERAHQELHDTIARAHEESHHTSRIITELEDERNMITTVLEDLANDRKRSEERRDEIETLLAAKREEAERIERAFHDERQKHSQSVTSVHETEMKVSEMSHRLETLRQRALEEYEIELTRKVFAEEDVFDLAQAREEINDLRQKIKTLGLVNPLAFEEWKKEKDRLDLLSTQRQDLVEARETLNQTIEEINRTAQEKFTETFSAIRENFISIFKSLFDEGDEADLILGESADMLEARIDIVAKPRGKRPHSIDMLSGGEKTLTAIALLFAIYLVKPSPFCILDEVDAPLDDANIDRFIRILRKFSSNTQFIVVTHNKRTMAAADTLYGVTMEEEGVSKLVAVNFKSDSLARFSNN